MSHVTLTYLLLAGIWASSDTALAVLVTDSNAYMLVTVYSGAVYGVTVAASLQLTAVQLTVLSFCKYLLAVSMIYMLDVYHSRHLRISCFLAILILVMTMQSVWSVIERILIVSAVTVILTSSITTTQPFMITEVYMLLLMHVFTLCMIMQLYTGTSSYLLLLRVSALLIFTGHPVNISTALK
jgi:hypothetical protein